MDLTEQNFGEGPVPGCGLVVISLSGKVFNTFFFEAGFENNNFCARVLRESLIKIRMTRRLLSMMTITSCSRSRRTWANFRDRPRLLPASFRVNTVAEAALPPGAAAPSSGRPRSVTRSVPWSCLSWSWCWSSTRRPPPCPSSWPGPGSCTTWPGSTSSPPGPSPGSAGSSTTCCWSCSSSSWSLCHWSQSYRSRSRHTEAAAAP